jgi:hypothetical protein
VLAQHSVDEVAVAVDRPVQVLLSGDVRKSPLDDMRKGPPADTEGVKDGEAGDNFSFL